MKLINNFFFRFINFIRDLIKSLILLFANHKTKFSLIYKLGYWKSKEGSVSGVGSNLVSTQNIRDELIKFIEEKKIKTFLDIPCGDFFWMKKVNLENINYTGGDIVDELININITKYSKKNIKFVLKDLINDPIEKYDVIFVRDCFVHLSDEEIILSLKNICSSRSKYFISTFFKKNCSNSKSKKIDKWRPLNLMNYPFNLPSPKYILNDNAPHNKYDRNKFMGVWEIKNIYSTIFR
jgi:2-polyprenyl-3-methyl-5-hydroxy-6-metoxy-1,4-benzoquinol methylase